MSTISQIEDEEGSNNYNNNGEDDIIVVDRMNNSMNSETQSNSFKIEENIIFCGRNLNVTKSQLIVLCLLMPYMFLTSSYYSLFAPFLPGEALKKGITQTQVGLIFGVFQLAVLFLSPFFGKYIDKFGIKFLFVSGLFLCSGSEILFGLLNRCPDGQIYFVMCMACRIVTALGGSMGQSFAIIGCFFPDRIASIVALVQVFNGLGLMVGPLIGGLLFELGGFQLPFFSMGGLLFLEFIAAFFIFPEYRSPYPKRINKNYQAKPQKLSLLKIPEFLLTLHMLFIGSLSIGFIEPSIQPHLIPLNLRPIELGAILFIPSLLYACITPVVGFFCDRYPRTMPIFMFSSALSSAISFSFFGPIPFYHLPLKISIVLSSFVAFGFSLGGLIIPVYSQLTKIALSHGHSNDLKTQGLISGMFNSVWSLGSLLGPVLGGIVVDSIGFDLASFCLVVLFLFINLLYGIFQCYKFCNLRSNVNHQRILLDDSEETNNLISE